MKTLITLVLISFSFNSAYAGGAFEGVPLRDFLECVPLDQNSDLKKAVFQMNDFTDQVLFSFETERTTPFAARLRSLGTARASILPARIGFRFDPVASFHLPFNGGKGTVTLKVVGIDQEDSDLEVVNVNCRRL